MTGRVLAQAWRRAADRYDADKLETVAVVLRRCADELEQSVAEEAAQLVSLTEGARLSGFTTRTLSTLVRRRILTNYGTTTRPRVAIGDLPRKPGLAKTPR